MLQERAVDHEVVLYLRQPPDRATLVHLVSILEDPVSDLVRRDATFKELGLAEADVADPAAVVELLLAQPKLLQRPVLVRGERAIIGRPTDRVAGFVAD